LNELDGHHDRIARGIYGLLTALAELSNDVSTRDTLLQLRDELLPLGLREIQRTYLEQSGNLQRVHDHVLPRSTVLLQTVPLPEGGTLADLVAGWAELGPEFDRLDSSRRSLRRELEAMVPTGTLIDARGEWIRLVNAMLAGADLEPLSPVDEARVFDPMREAEAKSRSVTASSCARNRGRLPNRHPADHTSSVR